MEQTPVALTVAGSDSGGGAGIQADLRTFGAVGVFGTTAITAITAQNLEGVEAVLGVPPEMVRQQIEAVTTGFDVRAVKTGMLWSAETVRAVARSLLACGPPPVVIDPVMVATSGGRLLHRDALRAYREELIPLSTLLTPNLDEAAALLQSDPIEPPQLRDAARQLGRDLGCAVLLKGGHLSGDPLDILFAEGQLHCWRHARVARVNTHGSGCMLSAAIAAKLSQGAALPAACQSALAFVHDALSTPLSPTGADEQLAHVEVAKVSLSHLEKEPGD